jgi:integrase
MPMKTVNQMILDRGMKPPKTGRDTWRVRQCPGLYLRVSASGGASWSVMYLVKGKQVKETLGTLADIPKMSEAVAFAVARKEQAAKGINPVAERRAAAESAAANTVTVAVERYLATCERDLKPKTVAGYRQIFSHDVLTRWGARSLAGIAKGDVLELLNDKAATRDRRRRGAAAGAAVQANRVLTRLRTFFGWAVANDLIPADPSAGVRKPAKEGTRDRVLNDDELRAFWAATEALDANRRDAVAVGALFRAMLLTGQRESEVAGMHWSEIDLAKRQWTIPGARAKNGKEHVVGLSDLALELLTALPRASDLVFSATGKMPAVGFARAKARLDAAMLREAADLPAFVLHDLRRSATSCMARLGIEPHVADKVLNHTAGTIRGVAAIYNRHHYLDERRLALEGLGMFIGLLVRDRLPGHVAEARVKLWLRAERERAEREAAGGNVVGFEPRATTA